ncbi:MAG: ABC transporter ATP-binding protein [Pelolinea sp.]|jgi:energy-coupling factor transporter ATP-binding protein EcfA2|nr:ABC transporter ATP-binding protein [Pelolinea sp.]
MENEQVAVIAVKDLHFAYADAAEILSGISFSIKAGEKVAIAGPNGAGKTTLLLNLTGLLPGSGQVTVNGMRLEKKNFPAIRQSVGLVFQSPDDQLFSSRVFEDVAYGLIYQGMGKEEIALRTQQALEEVGMASFEQAVPYHLSLGQKKRVAIATVLSMRPAVILFDEPTMGLDARAKKQFLQIARTLSQTVLVATHDMRLAAALCSRLLILDEGHLVYDGPLQSALQDTALLERHGLDRDW